MVFNFQDGRWKKLVEELIVSFKTLVETTILPSRVRSDLLADDDFEWRADVVEQLFQQLR
jgi:hypothetical protein